MTRSRNIIHDAHVKVRGRLQSRVCAACGTDAVFTGFLTYCWLLLAVCIDCLLAEAEMADPYCYWDASFPSSSFDVYGQYVTTIMGTRPGPVFPWESHQSPLLSQLIRPVGR